MKNKYDIVITTLPQIRLEPLHGPALLKSVVESNNFRCKVLDWNYDLFLRVMQTKWAFLLDPGDMTFRSEKHFKPVWEKYLSKIVEEWILELKDLNPQWLGISFFSQRNEFLIEEFLKLIRKKIPDLKIVVGGPYAVFTAKDLKERKLIDAYINGEGENTIVELLKGNFDAPGINDNPPQWIEDLDLAPFPDYSDYAMEKFPPALFDSTKPLGRDQTIRTLPITGSRGCINRCSFCDNFA